jgi:hypothetical protein
MNWFKLAKKDNKKDAVFSAVLKKNKKGFHYLDIPESFADGLYSMLLDDKAQKTPYGNKKYESIGAHVSVISDDEIEPDLVIKEVGDTFEFTLSGAKCVKPAGWDAMNKVCFIEVEAPSLEKLRQKYKLPKTYKDKGHNFHITFSVEEA